jgi:hypothetical protein
VGDYAAGVVSGVGGAALQFGHGGVAVGDPPTPDLHKRLLAVP